MTRVAFMHNTPLQPTSSLRSQMPSYPKIFTSK